MKKVTVFQGTVNGKIFNNVADYNAEITKLINAGEIDINATSSTSIKTVEENCCGSNCTCTLDVDNEMSIYPFMEADDPFYLDAFVTDDIVTNAENLEGIHSTLEKSRDYIIKKMKNSCQCEMNAYLNNVNDIILDIKDDIRDTEAAINIIDAKIKKLTKDYNSSIEKLEDERRILDSAADLSYSLKSFYEDIIDKVSNIESKKCCDEKCNCESCEPKIETSCRVAKEQTVENVKDILNRIFGTSNL